MSLFCMVLLCWIYVIIQFSKPIECATPRVVSLGVFAFFFFNLTVPARGIFSCSVKTLGCGVWDLVHQPGIKPGPPALGALSLSHWTIKEVTQFRFIICNKCAAQLRGVSSKGGCARVEPSGLWGLYIFYFILL